MHWSNGRLQSSLHIMAIVLAKSGRHLSMPLGTRPPVGDPPAPPGTATALPRGVFRTRCGSCGSAFTAAPPSSALRQQVMFSVRARVTIPIRSELVPQLHASYATLSLAYTNERLRLLAETLSLSSTNK